MAMGLLSMIMRRMWTGQFRAKPCDHLDQVQVHTPGTKDCEACVALGDTWPATRMCLVCGFIGCCDGSKNKHMKKHFEETGHPVIGPSKAGRNWVWCYIDQALN